MSAQIAVLICFAVENEARPFRRASRRRRDLLCVATGMGARNACRSLERALTLNPGLVITCGFAGGLNPQLATGDLLYAGSAAGQFQNALTRVRARPGTFHLSDRVAVTTAEKTALWKQTGADAVEMESCAMARLCSQRNVPCLILRVILDPASEDLPLNFNTIVTNDLEISPFKLAGAILAAPWKIQALLRLQRQSSKAAKQLSGALSQILRL